MDNQYLIAIQNETKQQIIHAYNSLTQTEKGIADFFISNIEDINLASRDISSRLFVSEASLSRFSKKCGYKGYREFIYDYEKDLECEILSKSKAREISMIAKKVQNSYQTLLQSSLHIINEDEMKAVAELLSSHKRVFVYGIGSSGFVAEEFELRFMRLGLDVTAITDSQRMKMSASILEKDSLVIALSLSGKTEEIVESMKMAKKNGASVVFVTAYPEEETAGLCDRVIQVASLKNLDTGTKISPQFTMLIMMDVLYSYYVSNDTFYKAEKYKETLSAIKK